MKHQNLPKSLSHTAYGNIEGSKYVPYVSNRKGMLEVTGFSLVVGIILAILFGASNAYLGLTAGMTVAGGIPGTIIGAGLLAVILKRQSILEVNVMQSMASGGESVASGIIFVLPGVIILGMKIDILTGIAIGITGVALGVGFITMVRKYLLIEQHGILVYPESMAVSEVMVASNSGGPGLKFMSYGAGIGAAFSLLGSTILGVYYDFIEFSEATTKAVTGNFKYQFGIDVNPALIGVGYIVGKEVGIAMFAGAVLANLVLIPLIGLFTGFADPAATLFPSSVPLIEMSSGAFRGNYIRYIGAGAIAMGGLISVIKMAPTIVTSLKSLVGPKDKSGEKEDLPGAVIIVACIAAIAVGVLITESIMLGLVAGVLSILCSLLFTIVAARMTGQVGTSNLPVSGMTIASLLVLTPVFALLGYKDTNAAVMVILFGTIIVTAVSTAGGFAQSLKATYIIGGGSLNVQKMFTLAGVVGVLTVIPVILLLEQAYGFTAEGTILQAPQANLMATLVNGVLTGELPWIFIIIGMAIAFMLWILNLPIMSIAIGMYLPIGMSGAVLVGGLVRWAIERKYKNNDAEKVARTDKGTIISAGFIAGYSLMGLLGAIFAVTGIQSAISLVNADGATLFESFMPAGFEFIPAVIFLVVFVALMVKLITTGKTMKDGQ